MWDISDKRKEEEEEKAALEKSWLDDHSAVLMNNHSVLMQVTVKSLLDLNNVCMFAHFVFIYQFLRQRIFYSSCVLCACILPHGLL